MNTRWGTIAFVVLMLGLTALFATLGLWQLNRLAEKDALVAAVDSRTAMAPLALPPLAEWVGFDAEVYNYRPVTVTGTFVPSQTVRVFTSLSDARGDYDGPGFWVITPLRLVDGGVVLVNRGFVPQRLAQNFAAGEGAPLGTVTITGLARTSEQASSFTPGPDTQNRIEWVSNVPRLGAFLDPALAPLAPILVDAPAGAAGALPQGGESVLSFPNNHLGYAITWFGFALITPILLLVWLLRRPRRLAKP